jgi:type IV pilus assembly protein PilE
MMKSRRADAKIALTELAQAQETFYTDRRTYALNLGTTTSADTIRCQSFCEMEGALAVSPDGYYVLTIDSRSGDPADITTGFVLTATARSDRRQKVDTECQTFTLDSINNKGAKDAGNNPNEHCW